MQRIVLEKLYTNYVGRKPEKIEELGSSGSNRRYFRLSGGETSIIGVLGTNLQENEAFLDFDEQFAAQGLPVLLSSGYRSYYEQSQNFQRKLNEGYSREVAATIVAIPGTSEHQTGLCCDITDIYRPLKDPDVLSQTDTFKWLNEHCAEYGFILRFPNGAGDITGIIYEPWHFRYVGAEAAEYIKANDLTLEEFVAIYTGEDVPGSDLFGPAE